jgi:hypothetical protein
MRSLRYAAALAGTLALAACSPDSGRQRSPTAPSLGVARGAHASRMLRHEQAISFPRAVASMWAVRGEVRAMAITYPDGTRYATFRVGAASLETDASGAPLAPGDSVLITMRMLNPSVFAVDMQPSGLRFAAGAPAELQFNLARAGRAAMREQKLSLLKQESAASPWEPISATFDYAARTATAEIPGFTIYAIIY